MSAVLDPRRALLAVGLVFATLAAVFAAPPSSARVVTAEKLGAVTTITTTTSGTASVVLYDDATVSAAPTNNPDISISGKGRLVGFDLISASNSQFGAAMDELTAERLPAFAGAQTHVTGMSGAAPKCTGYPNETVPVQQECSNCTYSPSPQVPLQASCTYDRPRYYKLHEGYYQLSVLTDGAPLTITIRLHGLGKSHTKVRLQSTFRSLETPLTQHESVGTSVVTFGGSASFAHPTEILTFVAAKTHPNSTIKAGSLCLRSDSAAPPPYAYSPACPGGQNQGYGYWVNLPGGVAGFGGAGVFAGNLTPTGDINGVGGSIADSDGPSYVGGVAVWIDGPAYLPF
ncbi:MAG: hypothetical protein QOC82_2004 [Frankiaceae bacterium]|jgi:hypothetical protein|nr:hypothetical protein [Frankiaceae bacterium]